MHSLHRTTQLPSLFLIALSALVALILMLLYAPAIFQEGNPWPQVKGIAQLALGRSIVNISDSEAVYMTRGDDSALIAFFADRGYVLTDQMGSGYFFENREGAKLVATRRQYSRFYSLWNITQTSSAQNSIAWVDYIDESYGLTFRYPSVAIPNQLWGSSPRRSSLSEILLPNEVSKKDGNFYLHQVYEVISDTETGKLVRAEHNTIPEYDGSYSYPVPWHIAILDAADTAGLEEAVRRKLGPGCSYAGMTPTAFEGNYRVKIRGDGKDMGETQCPVNYTNYIIYSPERKKVAFWSTGQECQIGLGFAAGDCFDQKISDSFHFYLSE